MKSIFLSLLLSFFGVFTFAQVQSPDDFFPHKVGEHFTPHHLVVDYFQHIAAESPMVKLIEYGRTNQDRPLLLAIITTEENHSKLEDIRLNNLRMAGIESGAVDNSLDKALVWLSFSVHGNEAAGTESAPSVLYELVNSTNRKTKEWLKNTVVFMDPSVNPDGFSRYTNWVRDATGPVNNTDINDIEHNEPWPGGRVNHYLFDLNRDWAWQTQIESQQRMKLYNQWLPHVHADLHEMSYQEPYYFAPAARPYHRFITKWQRDFQETIGRNHAKYFDQEGWLYFTKEVFDLFYPSYGDTYPTYSGAIGMTYEQGGSSVAGRGVDLPNGEILTLADRIEHHKTTALSTVEISSLTKDELVSQFKDFYQKTSNSPLGEYKSYVIKRDPSNARIKALAELLRKQDIKYKTVKANKSGSGFSYEDNANGSFTIEPGDMVISAYQAKSVLTQILMDPVSELEDSLTYDITAWSLPYAYGVKAYASTQRIDGDTDLLFTPNNKMATNAYGYVIPWTDLEGPKAAAHLLKNDISVRYTTEEISYDGQQSFPRGSLVITRADNKSKGAELLTAVQGVRAISDVIVYPLQTGFASKGPDLGSDKITLIKKPKVLAFMGEGVGNNAFGQLKWYFDKVIGYPLTIVDIQNAGSVNLDKYNTIIMVDGWYKMPEKEKIAKWVSDGGKLIAIGRITRSMVDDENFALKKYADEDTEEKAKEENKAADMAARYNHYSERERLAISDYVPGAIFKLITDETHPLAYGLGDSYFSLRTSSNSYPLLVGESNVIYHPKENGDVIGFAGSKVKKRLEDSVAFAVENKGRGTIIYMVDNPLFRGFWYNGLFLFSNALFLVE